MSAYTHSLQAHLPLLVLACSSQDIAHTSTHAAQCICALVHRLCLRYLTLPALACCVPAAPAVYCPCAVLLYCTALPRTACSTTTRPSSRASQRKWRMTYRLSCTAGACRQRARATGAVGAQIAAAAMTATAALLQSRRPCLLPLASAHPTGLGQRPGRMSASRQ